MTLVNHTTDATTTTSTIIEPNNDEYDDLPMLDFDEIDRLIAQRNTITTGGIEAYGDEVGEIVIVVVR